MAVEVINADSGTFGSGQTAFSHASEQIAGNDRIIIGYVSHFSNGTLASLLWGGVAMTALATVSQGTITTKAFYILEADLPDEDGNSVNFTGEYSGTGLAVEGIIILSGVNQAAPVPVSSNVNGTSISHEVTISEAGIILSLNSSKGSTSIVTRGSGQIGVGFGGAGGVIINSGTHHRQSESQEIKFSGVTDTQSFSAGASLDFVLISLPLTPPVPVPVTIAPGPGGSGTSGKQQDPGRSGGRVVPRLTAEERDTNLQAFSRISTLTANPTDTSLTAPERHLTFETPAADVTLNTRFINASLRAAPKKTSLRRRRDLHLLAPERENLTAGRKGIHLKAENKDG